MADIRVLHVDDDPDVRLLVEASLGLDPGLVTQSCASGAEALTMAAHWRPDLILLDATMPDMDGPATLAQLKHDPQTAGIPVLFLTASCQDSDVERFRAIGSAGVIAKPFDPRALAPSVRSHTHQVTEPAVAQPAAALVRSPAGASLSDSGASNQASLGAGTSMASGLGETTAATPAEASGIVLVDHAGRPLVLPLGNETTGGGQDWHWAALDRTGGLTGGHAGLLDFDTSEIGPLGSSLANITGAESSQAGSLFSGSRASGHDAVSDLFHANAWSGAETFTTGQGHDIWTVGPSPMLQQQRPFG